MMNRKSIRILITLVLAAAICSALGSEAHAAAWGSRSISARATFGSKVSKPTLHRFQGEPDAGGNQVPLPPKTDPTSGAQLPNWAQRALWLVRIGVETVSKRSP
jgi:hypothetical protein